MPQIHALIVAAGSSTRLPGEVPKAYRRLDGQAVLRHSIKRLMDHPAVTSVQVVIHPDHRAHYEAATRGLDLSEPVMGGATRQESVLNGLKALARFSPDYVLIHDAARPNLSAALIDRVIAALADHPAVIPAIAVADTIRQLGSNEPLPRERLRAVQTPQAFHYEVIMSAHRRYSQSAFTDDAGIVEADGVAIHLVEGDVQNRKLTTIEDWNAMQQMDIRTGLGFDVHALVEDAARPLMLCGIAIDSPMALEGHSDADVGLHALVDALLGTMAAGDIGQHFPPSDAKWKGCNSAHFVQHCVQMLRERAAQIRHVDITVVCEQPKLSPYRDAMRQRISGLLEIDISRVSVKATTTEKLGFTGRGEGIAAQCVATVALGGQA